MWWLILLLILAAVIGWMMIDFRLGRSHFIRTRTRRDYEKRMSDIQLFSRGPELFDQMFKEMREPKTSDLMVSLLFMFYFISSRMTILP